MAIKYSFLVERGQKIDEEKKRWETSSPPGFPLNSCPPSEPCVSTI